MQTLRTSFYYPVGGRLPHPCGFYLQTRRCAVLPDGTLPRETLLPRQRRSPCIFAGRSATYSPSLPWYASFGSRLRQASQETAEYLQRCLGNHSGFAHSKTEHGGEQTSQGQVEQAVALMTAQAIKQLGDTDIIGFHRNLPPFRAHRMDWRRFPLLVKRQRIPPPRLPLLPPLGEGISDTASSSAEPSFSWRHDPALLRWGSHLSATYGGDNRA